MKSAAPLGTHTLPKWGTHCPLHLLMRWVMTWQAHPHSQAGHQGSTISAPSFGIKSTKT